MGKKQKSRHDSSGGEDFDFDATNDFSEDSSSEVEIIEKDTWQPIVLGQKARHDEYDKASKSDLLDE